MKLYGFGAEIKARYPLRPIFHDSGLNITVMSPGGKLTVGFISCRHLVDDLWDLADRFETKEKNCSAADRDVSSEPRRVG